MVDPENVKSIFSAASEKPLAERAAYLDEATAGDAVLRARVEALLEAHDRPDSFLNEAAAEFGATIDLSPAESPLAERPGTLIGPYKLLEQIGEGGMGVVYMAEQQRPVHRRVALKIIKAGMDTRQVIARFEAERQALALMDHSNIARVLDAGATDSGRPYFVMELVRGIPITEYCDQHNLSIPKRLELFSQVCQSVQHAHQKGLIHRDIKPSNVLVSTQDDRPVAKVIDFGVAKATQGRLTEKTLFTEFQNLIGTPAYMSPEQAGGSLDIDTRSDIYSLGVLLYELLVGSPPFDPKELRSKAFAEMQRIIREVEPPTPSRRLSTLTDTLPSVAAQRSIEPRKLAAVVRGELDWIVMKALEKDRSRRYETANALAIDLQHYLADEPVQACPPTAAYRLKKSIRRNKAGVLIGLAIVALLLSTVVMQSVNNARVRRESAAKAVALTEKDAALVTARQAVDQMLTRVANERLTNVPLARPLRNALLQDALRFYEGFMRQAEAEPVVRLETALVLRSMAGMQRDLGRLAEARQSLERSLELIRMLVAAHPNELTYREQLAEAHTGLAFTIKAADKQGAEMHLREAYRTYSGLEQDFPEWVNTSAACVRWLGDVANERGDRAEAERLYREAVALQEALLRSKDVPDLITIEFLCWSRFDLARFLNSAPAERAGAAEPLFQGVLQAAESGLKLDPQHRGCQFARALANWHLGIHYQSSGRTEEAIPLLRHSLEDAQSLIADNPWAEYWGTLRDSLNALLQAQQSLGDSEGAKQTVLQTYHWLRKTAPRVPDDPGPQKKLLECQAQIVTLMRSSGQERDADALSRDATARLQDVINHAELAGDADQLTIVYATAIPLLMGSEQPEQARELCRRLLYVTPQNAQALNRVAWFLATAENPAHRDATLAIKFGKRAVELIPQDGNIWNTLGAAQFRAGDFPGAIEALEKSMELRSGGDASDWFFLAMAEWQLGHKDQARTWYDKAVEWMDKNQPKNEELLRFRAEAAELLGIQSPATNNHEPNT